MTERARGPGERPNFGEPSIPRPAASVVLLRNGGRDGDRGLEVLMLKRNENAHFMPGVWVFPGGALAAEDGEDGASFRSCARRELAEEAGIELPADAELVPFARWITPEAVLTRFDARFFLALAPPHGSPRPDGAETTEAGWFAPRAVLDAQAEGRMALAFPTVKQLQALDGFASADEAIEAHRCRPVEPILPKVVATPDGQRIALPGDPDYPA